MKNDLGELDRLSEKLAVPEYVADEAARICERDLERGLATGRPLTHAVAASLYAACREKGFPTTLVDVARASGVRRKDMARFYRLLVSELDLKIPVADPADYVAMVASRANASGSVRSGRWRYSLSEEDRCLRRNVSIRAHGVGSVHSAGSLTATD